MKRITLLLLSIVSQVTSVSAQGQLWGIADAGGANAVGTIFKINTDGSGYQAAYSFLSATGCSPHGRLLRATDGMFYGTTQVGGTNNIGVVYRFNPYNGGYTVLHNFSGGDGKKPYRSALIQATNGLLYGVTEEGGANNVGVIFSIDPTTGLFTKLYDFAGTGGKNPRSGLVQITPTKLIGTTYYGGSNYDAGLLYSFNIADSSYNVLREFNPYYEGSYPLANLFMGLDGRIYGSLSIGTSGTTSWIFSVDTAGGSFRDCCYLDGTTGLQIMADVIQAPDGKLYGTGHQGGTLGKGTVFSADTGAAGQLCTALHSFNDTLGTSGAGGVMVGSDGFLYGLATYGGDFSLTAGFGGGVLYRIDTSGANFTVLHVFNGVTGYNPWGSLIETEVILGMEEQSIAQEVSVFPVPSNGEITVKAEVPIDKVWVYAVDGRLVQELTGEQEQLVLQMFTPGIYILRIQAEKQTMFKRCLITN